MSFLSYLFTSRALVLVLSCCCLCRVGALPALSSCSSRLCWVVLISSVLVFTFCRTLWLCFSGTVLSPAVFLFWCLFSFMQVDRTCVGLQRKLGCDVSSDSSLLPFLVVLLLVTPLFPLCVKALCFRSSLFETSCFPPWVCCWRLSARNEDALKQIFDFIHFFLLENAL